MSSQEIVFWDVDDTLLRGQSQKLFIAFMKAKGFVSWWFYIKLSCWFVLYKLHFVHDPTKVAQYAFSFLKGMTRDELASLVDEFFKEVLVLKIYQDAVKLNLDHQKEGRAIYLVSNAFDTLIERIAQELGARGYIATKLRDREGVLTGGIDGTINYGVQKAEHLRIYCVNNQISLEHSWGYSDHVSDVPFLKLVRHPYFVNPKKGVADEVKKLGFGIVVFKK